MRWTRERPQAPGWYWWREDHTDLPLIQEITEAEIQLGQFYGEWCAIPLPGEDG